MKFFSKNVRWL